MISKLTRACATVALASCLSGCVFTQWTDHAFYGSPDDPQTYPRREWAFNHLLPLAVVGDILTAPIQAVYLAIAGDDTLYRGRNCPSDPRRNALCMNGRL